MKERLHGLYGPLAAPRGHPMRHLAATALRGVSLCLARLARTLAHAHRPAPQRAPVLEFYAEAGAPEGALYVDGEWIGKLPGVNRL
jgi:hypothetical protein